MWFWWALASAFVSGISVIFNKKVLNKGVHSSIVSFVLFTTTTIVAFPLMLLNNDAQVNSTFFVSCVIAALVFSVAKTIQLNIFKKTNLSDVYSLAAITPVTLYILSVIFLSEQVKGQAVVGIFLMAIGVYILNYDYHNKNLLHPIITFMKNRYSQLYVVVIILSNICAIAEKYAINNTFPQSVYFLAFWENFFLTIILGAYVIKTNKRWVVEIKSNLLNLLIGGIIFTVLYFLVLFGFKDGPISLVAGVKKLEVLFVIILSFIFFGERPGKRIYVATILILISVFLVKL